MIQLCALFMVGSDYTLEHLFAIRISNIFGEKFLSCSIQLTSADILFRTHVTRGLYLSTAARLQTIVYQVKVPITECCLWYVTLNSDSV